MRTFDEISNLLQGLSSKSTYKHVKHWGS